MPDLQRSSGSVIVGPQHAPHRDVPPPLHLRGCAPRIALPSIVAPQQEPPSWALAPPTTAYQMGSAPRLHPPPRPLSRRPPPSAAAGRESQLPPNEHPWAPAQVPSSEQRVQNPFGRVPTTRSSAATGSPMTMPQIKATNLSIHTIKFESTTW